MKHHIINCPLREVICFTMINFKDKESIKNPLDNVKIVMEIKAHIIS